MPNLRPVLQEETLRGGLPPSRSASGADVGGPGLARLGATIGEEGPKAAMSFYEAQARQEVTDAQAAVAKFGAQKTLELDARSRASTPDQHASFAEKFNDDLQPQLQGLGDKYETVQGQQAFQRAAGELTGHFIQQAGLHQAQLIGTQAKQTWLEYEHATRNSVLDNPLGYDRHKRLMLETLNDPRGAYFGYLKAEERAVMTRTAVEGLAESAVLGVIREGAPELALKQLTEGAWNNDLKASDKERLERIALIAIHAKEVEKSRQHTAKEQARKDAARATEGALVLKLGGGKDGRETLTAPDVIRSGLLDPANPGFDPVIAKELLGIIHTRSREQAQPIVTDPGTMLGLMRGIREGTVTDESKINIQYNAGRLTFSDFTHARKELAEMRTVEGKTLLEEKEKFLTGVKHQITKANPLLGALDPSGDQDFYEFSRKVGNKVEEYKKAKKNPYDLFDPAKPEYLGNPNGLISNYQKTTGESMNTIRRNMTRQKLSAESSKEPRRSGETIPEYLKRTTP